jgi:hypothetical protein
VSTSSDRGARRDRSDATIDRPPAPSRRSATPNGRDVAVAVDLIMLHRCLTADEAHDLLRGHAAATGRDLGDVASDVIDLGTARLLR